MSEERLDNIEQRIFDLEQLIQGILFDHNNMLSKMGEAKEIAETIKRRYETHSHTMIGGVMDCEKNLDLKKFLEKER